MKDIQRYALLGAIFIVLFLLLLEWNKFSTTQQPIKKTETLASSPVEGQTNPAVLEKSPREVSDDDIPETKNVLPASPNVTANNNGLISIHTDVLDIKIDLLGGDIVMVSLPAHSADIETPEIPFELLNRNTEKLYISQSGLVGPNGTDKPGYRPLYKAEKTSYTLMDDAQTLTVDLTLPPENGVTVTKRFVFARSEYLMDVLYLVDNQGNSPWQASFFGQIKRDGSAIKTSATGLKPFLGAATTTAEEHYKKMDFKKIEKEPLKETTAGGWVAMVQHYFISAWIAPRDEENSYSIRKLKNESIYILGYTGPLKTVEAGSVGELGGRFYAGPKITKRLEEISPYLDLTVDYGWLWMVAKPIHQVLQFIHKGIQNWGWSIVALTILIKILLFPLSHKAYISMGHMRKVAPKMAALKEQCGDNRQKLQEEMMKLYRTEKINPLGGCLPMLLQMPVFISLYWVLMESVELRHAPFVGWIQDLSVMDPWFCLPILMGISMYFQQKMNPAPPDPMQAKIMQFLPVIFTVMFLWFPAGLVLYWLVNNITSMIHQTYINKQTELGKL
jgi:YidC/Oxa1 family membrane protein insertase